MAKGGYRAGGGRPPGIKETRPRRRKKPSGDSDQAKIREMLSIGINAKARMYQELLQRVGRNENLTITEKKMLLKLGEELSAVVGKKPPASVTDGKTETPLEFLLRVMNDKNEPGERRERAAIAACPYVHPRRGEAGTGKKEAALERAKIAGAGKFASMHSPLRVIK
jgi:hypothetical protein